MAVGARYRAQECRFSILVDRQIFDRQRAMNVKKEIREVRYDKWSNVVMAGEIKMIQRKEI